MLFKRLSILPLLLVSCLAIGDSIEDRTRQPIFLIAEVWPWGYLDEQYQPAGLIHEFASRLVERSGVQMQYRVLPHQRVLAELEHGGGDFTLLFQNPAVADFAEAIGQVQVSDILLITPKDSSQPLTLEALAGKRLGFIGGTNYGEAFHADQHTIKVPISGLDQALPMLQLGRLDAMITSDILLHYSLKQTRTPPAAFRASLLTQGHAAYLYMATNSPGARHLPAVRNALQTMRDAGELDDLFRNALELPPLTAD